jgi:hypothetical protein
MRPDQPDESYYDTFHGRGQDEQDQHDLDEGFVELEDLSPESAVRRKSLPRMQATPASDSPIATDLATQASTVPREYAPPPIREQFGADDEFEEAQSRWRWTVGRNKAFEELRSQASQPKPERSEP